MCLQWILSQTEEKKIAFLCSCFYVHIEPFQVLSVHWNALPPSFTHHIPNLKKDCIIFMRGNYEHVQDIFPQCVQLLTQRFCWRLFSFSQPFLFLLPSMFIFHMLLMYTQNSRSHVAKWPSRKK